MPFGFAPAPPTGFGSQELRDAFLRLSVPVSFPAEVFLFHAGNRIANVFYIETGTVNIYQYADTEKNVTLYTHTSGELVGLDGLFIDEIRAVSAITSSAVTGYKISKENFLALFYSNPSFATYIVTELSRRLKHMKNKFVHSAALTAEKRVVFSLLQRLTDYATNDSLRLEVTQQELANLLSLSRQTIAAQLKRLQDKGIIQTKRGQIVVCDIDKLREEILGED